MSSRAFLFLVIAFLISRNGWTQQDPSPLSAKVLYYLSQPDDEKPPPQPETKAQPAKARAASKPSNHRPNASDSGAPKRAPRVMLTPAVQHLGLRYNVLLVDKKYGKRVPADPDRSFQPGECVQLDFAPNRSGYLYVFNRGSSGRWQALFPSTIMSDEINIVHAREAVRVPSKYCFRIDNPPGTEHLFVVLSRNQEDMHALDRAIRTDNQPSTTQEASQPDSPAPVLVAGSELDSEVERMRSGLGTKDLSVEKIGEPNQPDEPNGSVYFVNASNAPSDRLVTEILLRHQ